MSLKNNVCHAKVPFDTENRPDILAICRVCPHNFGDHNIYCSKCQEEWDAQKVVFTLPKYPPKHEFMVECGGPLKKVHLSREKWRTTKCLKCGYVWLVRGDN